MNTLKTAVGRRNSQADQDNLDSAHAALVEAGASCGKNPRAVDAGATSEHQARLDAAHDSIVGAGAECENADDGAPVARSAAGARQLSDPPNPYAKATARAASIREALHPTTSPGYQPKGTPADPYAVSLALRTALASDTLTAPPPMPRDAAGVPNAYSPEAIRKHQESRR